MSTGIILLCILGMIIQASFIAVEHKEKYVGAVCLKGSASVVFVIIGAIAFASAANTHFAKPVFIGLILGAVGDVLLNLRFVFEKNGQKIFLMGIAAFLAGHILYLVALIPQSENLWICVIIGAIIAAAILAYIFKTMEVKTAFKVFGVFYIGAVVIMTAIAIGNLIANPATATWLYAIGAVLFMISDVVLIFNTFGNTQKFSLRITNLSLYYIGQLLIACSLFCV